ncbi:MAG: hypothetical protein AAFW84_24865 [Cyanobacteria bacterium J06635_15]
MAQDKIRWVIHYQAPSTLSECVQEVGRGGRDGKTADALTLVSEPTGWLDPQDQQRWKFFADNSAQLQQEARRLVRKLPKEGSVMEVAKQYEKGAIPLPSLHSTNQHTWLNPFHYRLSPVATTILQQLPLTPQLTSQKLEQFL